MEDVVNASTPGGSGQIVVAGAGYAGLHVALRLTAKLRNHPMVELTLVDRHDYHQALTELPPGVDAFTTSSMGQRPPWIFVRLPGEDGCWPADCDVPARIMRASTSTAPHHTRTLAPRPVSGICCSHQTIFPVGVRREPHLWARRLTI